MITIRLVDQVEVGGEQMKLREAIWFDQEMGIEWKAEGTDITEALMNLIEVLGHELNHVAQMENVQGPDGWVGSDEIRTVRVNAPELPGGVGWVAPLRRESEDSDE